MHKPLITPHALQELLPISASQSAFVARSRKKLETIVTGKSQAIAVAVGPCSIHCEELTLEYAKKLKTFIQNLSGHVQVYMRVFFEKPRTRFAWKGFIHDPNRDQSYDLEKGVKQARHLLQQITELGIPVVTEMLDPHIALYIQDFISWAMIGSRTSTSQVHRQLASHLPFPVGFKNTQDGSPTTAIDGLHYARHPQKHISTDLHGQLSVLDSPGNPYTHLVLRGGSTAPNFDTTSVEKAFQAQVELGINTPILIDCSHDNVKGHKDQIEVFKAFLAQACASKPKVFGAMIESHLEEGNAVSLTDPCLGLADTFKLLEHADKQLSHAALALS